MSPRESINSLASVLDDELIVLPVVVAEGWGEGRVLGLPCQIVPVNGKVVELADEVVGEAQSR